MKPSELLSDESKWTKGVTARDKNGAAIASFKPEAVSFCLLGACLRCDVTLEKIEAVVRKKYQQGAVYFNDDPNTTFSMIKEVLKEAGL